MHRLTAVVCLAVVVLLGPLAAPGSAAPRAAVLTGASYVATGTLKVTGEVTCTAGHYFDLQIVATQKNGAIGAGHGEGTCTGERQTFTASITTISDIEFVKGKVTTDMYGGSYLCDESSCHDVNLANHLKQKFSLR